MEYKLKSLKLENKLIWTVQQLGFGNHSHKEGCHQGHARRRHYYIPNYASRIILTTPQFTGPAVCHRALFHIQITVRNFLVKGGQEWGRTSASEPSSHFEYAVVLCKIRSTIAYNTNLFYPIIHSYYELPLNQSNLIFQKQLPLIQTSFLSLLLFDQPPKKVSVSSNTRSFKFRFRYSVEEGRIPLAIFTVNTRLDRAIFGYGAR